ncbi:hypothetical protein HYPBUDRAFT_232898 [Hyphopichia burtonii NRRL Y-1933]|uniref:Uncharacterized protein n=1 Tax=Hyphopichia burtonii NRRL Y-1933 TaxID=984485 RepID=A0A1E4RBX6_9ASCO|nr:hypothetical protein HYPBUDRAFT_232898 [Hyphopichia burtonii NRRL Y-1933]ODV64779.1 hypothetical protein HYPBUDRAFT_232898 [Hyphopichia burtonii NRRL Y-1933]
MSPWRGSVLARLVGVFQRIFFVPQGSHCHCSLQSIFHLHSPLSINIPVQASENLLLQTFASLGAPQLSVLLALPEGVIIVG